MGREGLGGSGRAKKWWGKRRSEELRQATLVLSRMVTNLVNEISPWTALIYILTQQIGLGLPDLGNITEVVFAHSDFLCKKVCCCRFFGCFFF